MSLHVAIAGYDGDADAEVAELSFGDGARLVVVDDETYCAGSGWLLGYAEGDDPGSAALVPEAFVQADGGGALVVAGGGPAAASDVSPEELWRERVASPLEDEMLKQSSLDTSAFRSYRFVLALTEGSLQFWRAASTSSDRAPAFPRVCQIELPTIYDVQKLVYRDDPRADEGLDFQFMYNVGDVMRVRAPTATKCSEWVRALTLLAGPNWTVLSGYGMSLRPPRPPHILAVDPGDREATVTVRSGRESRVDYFTVRSRLAEEDRAAAVGAWGGAVAVERTTQSASDRCTTVVSTLPEGRPVVLPVRGLRNLVSNVIEIAGGNYESGEGAPVVLRVSPAPRPPGPPEIVEVIDMPDSADLVLFVPDPGGAMIERITATVLPIPPFGPPPMEPRVAAIVPTRPGYGDRGQQMRVQLLGLQGGWQHVVTVSATNAGGEGEAVAVIANPRFSGKTRPVLEALGGVGTAEERAALEGMKISVLRAQAVALGCDAARVATAEDGDDPRRDFVSLILEQQALINSGQITIAPPGGGLGLVPAAAAARPAEVGWQGKAIEVLDGSEKWQGKYDTEAEKPDDLVFKQYDIVCVTVKEGINRGATKNAFWRGYLHGKDPATAGEFLQSHVMQPKLEGKGADRSVAAGVEGASTAPAEMMSPRTAAATAEPHKAVFDFDGDSEEEEDLAFKKGSILMVTNKGAGDGEGRDGMWWKGYVHGKPEKIGQFPSSYAKEYSGELPGDATPAAAPAAAPAPPASPSPAAAPAPAPAPPGFAVPPLGSAAAPAPAPAPAPAAEDGEMPSGMSKMQQMLWKKKSVGNMIVEAQGGTPGSAPAAAAPEPEPEPGLGPEPEPEPEPEPARVVPGPLARAGKA